MLEYERHFAAMGAPLKDIIKPFEPLGRNCEFGFIQHANEFGEGCLLSWAATDTVHGLIKLLDQKLTNLYDLDRLIPGFGGVMAHNPDYGIAFHSKIFGSMVDGAYVARPPVERAAIHAAEREKIDYLAGKMQRSLAAPRRIWVYKNIDGVSMNEALRLHAALKRYAPHRLLVVLEAKGHAPAGSVEAIDENLFLGHVSHYSPNDRAWDYDLPSWGQVLQQTLALTGLR